VRAEWRPLWQMWHEKRGDETPEDAIVVLKDPQIEGDSHAQGTPAGSRRRPFGFVPQALLGCLYTTGTSRWESYLPPVWMRCRPLLRAETWRFAKSSGA
jgi:hypothetical protein